MTHCDMARARARPGGAIGSGAGRGAGQRALPLRCRAAGRECVRKRDCTCVHIIWDTFVWRLRVNSIRLGQGWGNGKREQSAMLPAAASPTTIRLHRCWRREAQGNTVSTYQHV